MLDHDALSADDERLLELAMAIADGIPVDWSATPSATESAPGSERAETSSLAAMQLQRVERLVRGHEAVRSRPQTPDSSPARDTLLTQAGRQTSRLGDHPLRVQWGPLIVLEKIGRGSFGDVYRAWDPRLDREVALKLIPETASESDGSPVIEEGRLLARVRHANVLTVHGAERIEGRVGIWTEYIAGETLADEVARRGALPVAEATEIGLAVCSALGAVHAAGLLHRDVKAQNILRDRSGRIVLGDFGTGVEIDENVAVAEPQIAGTPLYLAPEMFEHRPATPASDLYSLGVVLYFLVTGTYPVKGRTLAEIREAHAREQPGLLRDACPELPDDFLRAVETLLATDPARRYGSAAAAEAALNSLKSATTPAVRPVASRRRSLPLLIAGMVLTAVGVAVAGLVAWRARSAPIEVRQPVVSEQPRAAAVKFDNSQLVTDPRPTQSAPPAPFRLTAGDWVLIARYDNHTGETVLDGTLDAVLKREFGYSEYVRVAQRDRWEDALAVIGRPLDSRLDPQLAREVSLRDGAIPALITGRVEKRGTTYTITSEIVDPTSGAVVATIRDSAAGPSRILPVVRRHALGIRRALGETEESIDGTLRLLERAPLYSLKALQLYAQGAALMNLRPVASTPGQRVETWSQIERLTRAALAEDDQFALASTLTGWAIRYQDGPAEQYLRFAERGFQLADGATPQERHFIVGSLHHLRAQAVPNAAATAEGRAELEQAMLAYESLLALQPDHYELLDNLRGVYAALGRFRELATMVLRLADARPRSLRMNMDAANALIGQGNLEAARRYAARAETSLSPETERGSPGQAASARFWRANLAWLDGNPREALRLNDANAAAIDHVPPEVRLQFALRVISLYLALGRLRTAEELSERMQVAHGPLTFLMAYVLKGRGDADRLREYLVTRWTHDAEASADGSRVEFLVPLGMLDEAERDAERYAERYKWFYPLVTGQLELGHGRPQEAISYLRPFLAGLSRTHTSRVHHTTAQRLADALESVRDVPQAIQVLVTSTEQRPDLLVDPTHSMWIESRAQLARLYRKNGQDTEAHAVETHLLKLLAVADADHPLLTELKARQ